MSKDITGQLPSTTVCSRLRNLAAASLGAPLMRGNRNIKAYATQPARDRIVLTLINKEPSSEAMVVIDAGTSAPLRRGSLIRLSGPSLESKSGVTLGGAGVSHDGLWKPTQVEEVSGTRGRLQVRLPAASAAMVTLHA